MLAFAFGFAFVFVLVVAPACALARLVEVAAGAAAPPAAAGVKATSSSGINADPRQRRRAPPAIVLSPMSAHGNPTMGDKSPKSRQKLADQKSTKTSADNRQKQAAMTAKQVPQKKK
jgi:hypothetical protein